MAHIRKLVYWVLALNGACGSGAVPVPERTRGEEGEADTTTATTATTTTTTTHDDAVEESVFPKDRVLDIEVAMSEEAWTEMLRTASQEIWSTAEVTIDGQSLGDIGIRPKGEYSLDSCVDALGNLLCDKLSLKLKFDKVDSGQRFHGLKKLILNKILDGASVIFETLGYRIFNDFGIVAPRTSYATVTVNGTAQGLYTVVEAVDGRLTKDRFEDGDGNLYKEAWPSHTEEDYFARALETNKETATHEAFIAFATDMLSATDETLPTTLAKYMDLDKVLDYMAVDYGIANWDGITTFYAGDWGCANHNYFMVQDANRARFTLIPWDLNAVLFLDHWLGNIQPWDTLDADCDTLVPTRDTADLYTRPASCDPMIRAIALSRKGYRASVRRLLDEVFLTERLSGQIDAYVEQVEGAVKKDPFVSLSDVKGNAAWIKSMVPTLRARLEEVVAAK
jgi:spore coat protein CotH